MPLSGFPARSNGVNVNKGTFGHVLVVAGSQSYTGAAILTAEASARTGAGKVSLLFPKSLTSMIVSRLSPVIITRDIETGAAGHFTADATIEALALCEAPRASVAALGPGLGRSPETFAFLQTFIADAPCPLVIDADALGLLATAADRGVSLLRNRTSPTVLTPHPGELAALLDISVEEIQADRNVAVRRAVQKFDCVVVLKGFQTLISDPENESQINSTGNAGLATAGTGDILTGIIASLIAQGLTPWRAAVTGVHLHGLAAEIAAKNIGGISGMIATDLLESLPRAITQAQKT